MSGVAPPGRGRTASRYIPATPTRRRSPSILADLIAHIPGAHSAALVDPDGESVDYTGRAPLRRQACRCPVPRHVRRAPRIAFWRETKTLVVRGATKSFLSARPRRTATRSSSSWGSGRGSRPRRVRLASAQRALEAEAGLSGRVVRSDSGCPSRSTCDGRRRPTSVSSPKRRRLALPLGGARIGRMGLANHDRAFRVRLETGAEVMIVRERGGAWYSEEPIDFTRSARRS
jgi:hypothetical protein